MTRRRTLLRGGGIVARRKPLRRLTPPDPPMLPIAVAGTATWLLLGLVLLAIRPTLTAGGNEDWAGICFAGALLGVVGIGIMALHDRRRRARAGEDQRSAIATRPTARE